MFRGLLVGPVQGRLPAAIGNLPGGGRRKSGLPSCLKVPEPGRLSVKAVSKSLGFTAGSLKKRYPEVYVQIRDLHAAYRKRMREELHAKREVALRAALLACVREGVYPRQDIVFRRAGLSPLYGMNPDYGSIWRQLRYESGLEIG